MKDGVRLDFWIFAARVQLGFGFSLKLNIRHGLPDELETSWAGFSRDLKE